jgi:aromatic ring-opening dioxygenase catalytic subunit (LigB family)
MDFPQPFGAKAWDGLKAFFSGILGDLDEKPKAIVVVTGHWEEAQVTVSVASRPPMLYDYRGFPPHTYELSYPAPGSPDLGHRISRMLADGGVPAAVDNARGFDHGVFVPMLIIEPTAQIPVVMVSMQKALDPDHHIRLGAALAPLRDEGILIIGSGSSFHNLGTFFDGADQESAMFDDWIAETVGQEPSDRSERLRHWYDAPGARMSHPRPDHLIPLMVAAGAAGEDSGRRSFGDTIGGKKLSCVTFG